MTATVLLVRRDDTLTVAEVHGEIDLANVGRVTDHVTTLVSNMAYGLILDLSPVVHLDSAGVRMLFTVARLLRERQQEFHLVVPEDSPVRRVLSVTKVQSIAMVHRNLTDALAGFAGGVPAA